MYDLLPASSLAPVKWLPVRMYVHTYVHIGSSCKYIVSSVQRLQYNTYVIFAILHLLSIHVSVCLFQVMCVQRLA